MANQEENSLINSGLESGNSSMSAESQEKVSEFLEKIAEGKNELSTDEIDHFLQVQDPEFASQLLEISKDKNMTMTEVEVDVETASLHDELERWRAATGIKARLYRVFPWLPQASLRMDRIGFRIFVIARAINILVRNLGHDWGVVGRRRTQILIIRNFRAFKNRLIRFISEMKGLSLRLKLAFGGLLVLFVGCLVLVSIAWKGKLLPQEPELFITDLAMHAAEVYEVNEEQGFENFYDNIRTAPNLLLIQKIVVNLKASQNSSPNPMLAIEFFVEGLNPDVIIEVKDREPFFRDRIQRASEEFAYDDLTSIDGKRRYLQVLLKDMNHQLSTGELRNIRIKTLVLKP